MMANWPTQPTTFATSFNPRRYPRRYPRRSHRELVNHVKYILADYYEYITGLNAINLSLMRSARIYIEMTRGFI